MLLKVLSEILERLLSKPLALKIPCGFKKGYGAQHCLLIIFKTWKEGTSNKAFEALLTGL